MWDESPTQSAEDSEFGGYYPGTGVFTALFNTNALGDKTDHITESYQYCKDYFDQDGLIWRMQVGFISSSESTDEYVWEGIYSDENPEEWYAGSANIISKEDFEIKLAELTGGVEKTYLEDNWKSNTEENREKYLN